MTDTESTAVRGRSPVAVGLAAVLVLPLNGGLAWLAFHMRAELPALSVVALFVVLGLVQLVLSVWALVAAGRAHRAGRPGVLVGVVLGLTSALTSLASLGIGALGLMFGAGGGWGRPLRVRGRQVHPALCAGSDWTDGARPDSSGLDPATRRALEALWLHDAQKEHASVPAFSRVSWLLAAVGAPAELLQRSHRAALEEIEHARLCFALAAGYGGRSHGVQAMPELLRAGMELAGDPVEVLVAESLGDGCQLEDFNADIAAACAAVCEEPATRAGLERIAREERSHAELSWAILVWLLERVPERARPALERGLGRLGRYARPTAVSWHRRGLVGRADPELLRRHGRLPDRRWRELWDARLVRTRSRARELLAPEPGTGRERGALSV